MSPDGVSWEAYTQLTPASFSAGPSPAVFLNQLWVFVRGNDGNLYGLSSSDGVTWGQRLVRLPY